jgi:NAD(P)-dependent dehydrogenase (short-subunit alcohol dehydrogenase family)
MPSLEGKVAIVTGAGRGIGREHALALAQAGAKVVVNDLGGSLAGEGTDATPAQSVVNEIVAAGGEAVASYDDVSDFAAAEHMIRRAIDRYERLDILVNNAGILRDRMLVNMTEDEWDAVISVHLKGHFGPTRHAAAYWREQSKAGETVRGRVINTSSPSGVFGNVGQANYGAAKAGLMGLTFVLAVEFMKGNAEGKWSLTANALAPAGMTRMVGQIPGMEGRPVPPEMNPDLNGPIVAFLGSEKAGHVNGQVFGRRGFSYTLFQTPKPIASMYKDGGLSAGEVAAGFDAAFEELLNVPGIPMTRAMKEAAAKAAAAKAAGGKS